MTDHFLYGLLFFSSSATLASGRVTRSWAETHETATVARPRSVGAPGTPFRDVCPDHPDWKIYIGIGVVSGIL